MEYTFSYVSPLGNILLASDGSALTGLWFEGQKYFAAGLNPLHTQQDLPVFGDAVRWLDLYFSGRQPDFTPALSPKGSPFRREVWKILLTIPYGQTMTYGDIALLLEHTLGRQSSARAVGGAVGHNPVSLIIPCHRVTGAGGSLTGYAGGLERKQWLLRLENASAGTPQDRSV